MSVKNDFERMKVSFVIIKILIFSFIAYTIYLLAGVVFKNIQTEFLSFLLKITIHLIILFILVLSFRKYHISINNLFGSLSIKKEHWFKLMTIKFLLIIFGVFSITTIFTLIELLNAEFFKSFLTDLDLSATENNFMYSILFYILSFTLIPVIEELLFEVIYLINGEPIKV